MLLPSAPPEMVSRAKPERDTPAKTCGVPLIFVRNPIYHARKAQSNDLDLSAVAFARVYPFLEHPGLDG